MAALEGEMIAAWKQEGGARRMHTSIPLPCENGRQRGICSLFSKAAEGSFLRFHLKQGPENQRKQECLWIQLVFQKAQRKALEGEISSDGEEDTGCACL